MKKNSESSPCADVVEHIANSILAAEKAIVVFDSECLLCDHCARWLARQDKRSRLFFAHLNACHANGFTFVSNSITLLLGRKIYSQSTAALLAIKMLGGIWGFCADILLLVPVLIRDRIYDFLARRRYIVTGLLSKPSSCNSYPLSVRVVSENLLTDIISQISPKAVGSKSELGD